MIILSEKEERLVETLRTLTPASANQVYTWINALHELGNGKSLDWSSSWSEEDMEDIQRASLAEFESREREAN